MQNQRMFDKALLYKHIGGNGTIVIIDVCYLISSVSFGLGDLHTILTWVFVANMLATCVLFQSFIISMGDGGLELNTEKIIYFPTTRYQFLWNKYAKTLLFLLIQIVYTIPCLGFGYLGNRLHMNKVRVVGILLMVVLGIILTSGIAILVMHISPYTVYLPMLFVFPIALITKPWVNKLDKMFIGWKELIIYVSIILVLISAVWLLLLWLGGKIYEKIV